MEREKPDQSPEHLNKHTDYKHKLDNTSVDIALILVITQTILFQITDLKILLEKYVQYVC